MKSQLKKKKGLFITFEGTEGAGKSTLIRTMEEKLHQMGLPVVKTREPGGTEVAEKIRSVILENPMAALTELFLYEASRAEHVQKLILPSLKEGKIVLCDRFTDSSLAYQSVARGLPWKTIQKLNTIATDGLKPDLTVWLDIDPKEGLLRAKDKNRFEEEGVKFQTRVRNGFQKAMRENPKHWIKLKVKGKTPEELSQEIFKRLFR